MSASGEYRNEPKDKVLENVSEMPQYTTYRLTIITLIIAAWLLDPLLVDITSETSNNAPGPTPWC